MFSWTILIVILLIAFGTIRASKIEYLEQDKVLFAVGILILSSYVWNRPSHPLSVKVE